MTERAKLLIEPGCEAGSKYCGECDKRIRTTTCHIFGDGLYGLVSIENEQIYYSEDDIKFYRGKECIKAEAKAKELWEKIEDQITWLEGMYDYPSSTGEDASEIAREIKLRLKELKDALK